MHELGMCEAIVDRVVAHARGRRVARVRIRVGRLHRVVPEAFAQSWGVAAEGTVAAGADPDLVLVPVRSRCDSCGAVHEDDDVLASCPACGGVDVSVAGGDELVVESIEYASTPGGG